MKEAIELKKAISSYCRACVNAGFCDADDCEFCAVNKAYEMAESLDAPKKRRSDFG